MIWNRTAISRLTGIIYKGCQYAASGQIKPIGFSREGTGEEREGETAAKDKIALFDCFFLPLVIWL